MSAGQASQAGPQLPPPFRAMHMSDHFCIESETVSTDAEGRKGHQGLCVEEGGGSLAKGHKAIAL